MNAVKFKEKRSVILFRRKEKKMYTSFEEMPVWQDSFNLADEIYNVIENFPKTEMYALADQLRRASVSISANIAEGFGRYHQFEKINFYYYARGSLSETKSLLLFALKRDYISKDKYNELESKISSIHANLNILIRKMKSYKKT